MTSSVSPPVHRVAPRRLPLLLWRQSSWIGRGGVLVAACLFVVVVALLRAGPTAPTGGGADGVSATATPPCTGQTWHVSVAGTPTNPGSAGAPLDLATALDERGPARPCDVVWVHPGTYRGTFISTLHGTPGRPIVVRALQGAAPVVIDSAPSLEAALTVRGTHAWFWGLEIANSSPDRVSTENGSWPTDLERGTGVSVRGTHLKFINMAVHDMARGFEVGTEAADIEIYGCLIFHNGWEGPEASNGHGIETRNRFGAQRLRDNVIFDQFSHGILAVSSETTYTDHVLIEGNTLFNNGRIGRSGLARDVLVGGAQRVQDLVFRDNATWGGGQTHIGLGRGCSDSQVLGNYLVGSSALLLANCTPDTRDNTVITEFGLETLPEGRNNTYRRGRPNGTVVRVRRNQYEPGLSYVTVYNWDAQPSVAVDAAALTLAAGDAFEVRDLQHDGAAPVVSGVVDGRALTLPLTARRGRVPVGATVPPPSTLPEFTVFSVRKRASQASAAVPST